MAEAISDKLSKLTEGLDYFDIPYQLVVEMRDDGGCTEYRDISDLDDIAAECADWVIDGDYGIDGASVKMNWTAMLHIGDAAEIKVEIDDGYETIEVEPVHSAMIAAATKSGDGSCGDDPDDHDWTSEGEGGCTDNPGVWCTGGTSMVFHSHCRKCGLRRIKHTTGLQRNPGEHDTVTYEMPEKWCEECQSSECECECDAEDMDD